MLRKLLAGWKQDSLVKSAFDDTNEMMRKAQRMFDAVADFFLREVPIDFDLYTVDKEINRLEIVVRRKVLEHLSINPRQELIFSLVLTTIINDIERIGDYSKNIYELGGMYRLDHTPPEYHATIATLTETVQRMFETSIVAFDGEDMEKAEQVMVDHGEVNRACEKMIRDLGGDTEIHTKNAVSLVLYVRYLKRVSAHLANVMSSVIKPFDRIGFFREQMIDGKKVEEEIEG